MYAIQCATSHGRVSACYGGSRGIPTIMSVEDGVLVAFSGSTRSDTKGDTKSDSVCQIQVSVDGYKTSFLIDEV